MPLNTGAPPRRWGQVETAQWLTYLRVGLGAFPSKRFAGTSRSWAKRSWSGLSKIHRRLQDTQFWWHLQRTYLDASLLPCQCFAFCLSLSLFFFYVMYCPIGFHTTPSAHPNSILPSCLHLLRTRAEVQFVQWAWLGQLFVLWTASGPTDRGVHSKRSLSAPQQGWSLWMWPLWCIWIPRRGLGNGFALGNAGKLLTTLHDKVKGGKAIKCKEQGVGARDVAWMRAYRGPGAHPLEWGDDQMTGEVNLLHWDYYCLNTIQCVQRRSKWWKGCNNANTPIFITCLKSRSRTRSLRSLFPLELPSPWSATPGMSPLSRTPCIFVFLYGFISVPLHFT